MGLLPKLKSVIHVVWCNFQLNIPS